MKADDLSQVAKALRAAAHALSGGTLAYPPKMADSIEKKVRQHLAAVYLGIIEKDLKVFEQELAAAKGEKGASVPFPRISSPAIKAMSEMAYGTILRWDGSTATDLDSLLAPMKFLGEEILETRRLGAPALEEIILTLSRVKNITSLKKLSKNELHVAVALMAQAYHTYGDSSLRPHFNALKDYLYKDYSLRQGTGGNEDKVKNLSYTLDQLKEKHDFYKSLVPKGLAKNRLAWEEPVDLTGLPKQYPIKVAPDLTINVVLLINNNRSFGGLWTPMARTIDLVAFKPTSGKLVPSKKAFHAISDEIRNTIEHELMHMVQEFMQFTLRKQQAEQRGDEQAKMKDGRSAGTPYSPKTMPGLADNKASKKSFPKANENERYYLAPDEFYPWVRNEAGAFVDRYKNAEDKQKVQKNLSLLWREQVRRSEFFRALKKHNPPMFRKAVGEGWKLVQKLG